MTHTAPTYLQSEKNIFPLKRSKALQYIVLRSIIETVRDRLTKGGCCDYDGGIHHSQGGVNRTGTLHLPGERNAPSQPDAGIPRGQGMAHCPIRVRGVESKETEAESIPAVSGKLISSSVAHLWPKAAWNPLSSHRRCSRYLVVYYSQLRTMWQGYDDSEVAVWEVYPMTTTFLHRVELFNADGQHIGSISELALSALIDSGLLDREHTPAESLAPTRPPCIECGEHRATVGSFCWCCFTRLKSCDPQWAAAWYGRDWDEACEQAEREVSSAD